MSDLAGLSPLEEFGVFFFALLSLLCFLACLGGVGLFVYQWVVEDRKRRELSRLERQYAMPARERAL